jgi:hypothetical protein
MDWMIFLPNWFGENFCPTYTLDQTGSRQLFEIICYQKKKKKKNPLCGNIYSIENVPDTYCVGIWMACTGPEKYYS